VIDPIAAAVDIAASNGEPDQTRARQKLAANLINDYIVTAR